MARAVLVGVPHHLTQRGLDHQRIFLPDLDYEVYLRLVSLSASRHCVDLLGYALMTNHVHWVATPRQPAGLAKAFGEAHGRYATYANARLSRSGHFWQNRFFSCALDQAHLWAALRYVERNPVLARIVEIGVRRNNLRFFAREREGSARLLVYHSARRAQHRNEKSPLST